MSILERTSVGRNTGRITLKKLKVGHIVLVDRFFLHFFFQIRGKVLGRTSVGANLIGTSVGRNFKSILAQKTIFFKSVKNFGDD